MRRLAHFSVARPWLALAFVAGLSACGGSGDDVVGANSIAVTAAANSAGTLAVGLKDEEYTTELGRGEGKAPYRYALVEGSLPLGLRLDEQSGTIAGRPALAGETRFTVKITDADGKESQRTYSIFIDESSGTATGAPGMAPSSLEKKAAVAADGPPDVSNLLSIVAGMGEGEWRRVNLNTFTSVWTPPDLRPLYGYSNPDPSKLILAWSSFVWDSNRASLILYGGGHANYRGNDVYAWRASSQRWERASLPSQMVTDAQGNWNAIDGADKAPASAHTYDNSVYLPVSDRVLVLGGAADANGGHYLRLGSNGASRVTGPYLFDPSRANPDRVGGSTGSHVQRVAPYPEVVGGNMWSNRESWLNASATSSPPSEAFTNGCTGYATENGRDVVYLRTSYRVYRYQLGDLATPASDSWKQVGQFWFGGSGDKTACAYDPGRKVLLATHNNSPFIYWDLNNQATVAKDALVTPVDPTGEFAQLRTNGNISLSNCGLEFDPLRKDFKLWCADGRVWSVVPPTTMGTAGWTITKAPTPAGAVPADGFGTGILGKWKYVPNLDVFIGLTDAVQGNIWIYKPQGWVNPAGSVNLPPSVSLTAPAANAGFTVGAPIAIAANALDGDGSVAKVEFFANGNKIGESTAPPYSTTWTNATAGTHQLTAVATDNVGATRTSAAVSIQVTQPVVVNTPPTVQLVQPTAGASIASGTPAVLQATAADSDGSVVRVEFYAGSTKLGESTAAPYAWTWTNPPVGTHALTAVATDNKAASTTSASVSLTVTAPPTSGGGGTVTLQRGIGTSVVEDVYLSSYHLTQSFGTAGHVQDTWQQYATLVRFAIFQSEGGPVPNGARIVSATLSLYKYSPYDMVYSMNRVLRSWSQNGATWSFASPGSSWSSPGANGMGQDVASVPEATASTTYDPGWINFNMTNGVQAMSSSSPLANYGWRMIAQSGYMSGLKRFYSSEAVGDTSLRPKLVIVYE